MANEVEFMVYCIGWWDVYDKGATYKLILQSDNTKVVTYPKNDDPENWINKVDRVYPAKLFSVEESPVKITPISTTTGFKYLNDNGLEEKVLLPSPCDKECVEVVNSLGQSVYIYTNDIPKLVAALKSAYEYEMGDKI